MSLVYDFKNISTNRLQSEEFKKELFEEFKIAHKNIPSAKPIIMEDIKERLIMRTIS